MGWLERPSRLLEQCTDPLCCCTSCNLAEAARVAEIWPLQPPTQDDQITLHSIEFCYLWQPSPGLKLLLLKES